MTLPPQVEVVDEVPASVVPVPNFVRRIGVITARIQGSWSLPGVPRSRDFHCRVRLHADDAGVLREVELWQCDDDPELRASLLKAIRASSPLPPLEGNAQPAHDLTLGFRRVCLAVCGSSEQCPAERIPALSAVNVGADASDLCYLSH